MEDSSNVNVFSTLFKKASEISWKKLFSTKKLLKGNKDGRRLTKNELNLMNYTSLFLCSCNAPVRFAQFPGLSRSDDW